MDNKQPAPELVKPLTVVTADGKTRRIIFGCAEGDSPGEVTWLFAGSPLDGLMAMTAQLEAFRASVYEWVASQKSAIQSAPAILGRMFR